MKRIILIAFTLMVGLTAKSQSVTVYPSTSNGGCNGSVSFNDTLMYSTWVWTNTNIVPDIPSTLSTYYNGLCAGTYYLITTDLFNVVDTIDYTIYDCTLNPMSVSVNIDNPQINGNCAGQLTANVVGGIAPYSYLWNNNNALNTATISNLCGANYNINITDNWGCHVYGSAALTNLISPTPILSTTGVINGVCNGNGILTNDFDFINWVWTDLTYSPIQNGGSTVSNLCVGTYFIITTDSYNVIDTTQFTVIDYCASYYLQSNVVYDIYNACVGGMYTSAVGGNTPYTFVWSNGITETMNYANSIASITNLCIGNYSVTVTDSFGCVLSDNASIGDSTAYANQNIVVTTNTIVPTSNNGACDGSITLNIYGSNPPFTINGNTVVNGIYTINNLCVGNYTQTVYDALGNTINYGYSIGVDPCANFVLQSYAYYDFNNACIGAARTDATGGTAPYTFVWNNGFTETVNNWFNGSINQNLCVGNYSVIVTDSMGCVLSDNVYVGDSTFALPPLTLNVNTVSSLSDSICDGTAVFSVSGGTPPYQSNNISVGNIFTIDSLCPGFYTTVLYDAYGNSVSVSYIITSNTTTIINTPYVDSTNVDSLLNDLLENCTVNYQNIDSAYVTSVNFITNDSVAVDFTIFYNNGQSAVVTDYYSFDSSSGVYVVVLDLFCPNKATNNFLRIYDQIYFDPSLIGTSWSLEITEMNSIQAAVYPIPFTHELNVVLDDVDDYQITIFDISGQQILSKSIEQNNVITLNLNELSNGQYIVRIQNDNSVITRKVVK